MLIHAKYLGSDRQKSQPGESCLINSDYIVEVYPDKKSKECRVYTATDKYIVKQDEIDRLLKSQE